MTLPPDALAAEAEHGSRAYVAAQHALWRQGRLGWLLHDGKPGRPEKGQKAADRLCESVRARGIRRVVYAIGRRWGKSHYFCVKACEVALRTPYARIPYAASTQKNLLEFILPIMRGILATAPDDMRPVVVGTEIRFANGSRIVMQGCEDLVKADRLRGPAAHMAVVDEAGFIAVLDYVINSVLLFQLATTDGMMLVGSSPPETPAHPFTKMKADAEERGAYMHATIHDAPQLEERVIETLCVESGGARSATWRREALAEFLVDPLRALVPEFSEAIGDLERPVVCEWERPEFFDCYVVGDLGYVDLTVILFAYYDFRQATIVVEDELVMERAISDQIQQAVARKEAALWPGKTPMKRVIDAPPITRADMSRLQDDDDPTSESRWSGARKVDRDAAVNGLRLDVGDRSIRYHPRCKVTIAHMTNGIWNLRRSDFDRSEGLGHFDGVAASMYLCRAVERARNPYPAPKFDRTTHFVPAHLRQPDAGGWAAIGGGKKR